MTWRATTLSTDPASLEVATTETVAIAFDTTLDLDTGESVTAAASRLLRLDTRTVVTIDPPTEDSDVLTQVIDCSNLVRGVDYELTFVYTIAPTKILSRTTVLQVVA